MRPCAGLTPLLLLLVMVLTVLPYTNGWLRPGGVGATRLGQHRARRGLRRPPLARAGDDLDEPALRDALRSAAQLLLDQVDRTEPLDPAAWAALTNVLASTERLRYDLAQPQPPPAAAEHLPPCAPTRALSQDAKDAESTSYKDAGVDVVSSERFLASVKAMIATTARPGTAAAIGGFGGGFRLAEAGWGGDDVELVAAADGVGTKLLVAQAANNHSQIGQDLVAMNVNDIVVHGAEPLFMLDYLAMGKLDAAVATEMLAGLAEGCRDAGCALIGGETAEMPGVYPPDGYDLAGCAVGAVRTSQLLPRPIGDEGATILGVASSGIHANGFSLVRKLVEQHGLSYDDPAPFAPGRSLGQTLLEPTRIYARLVQRLLAATRDLSVDAGTRSDLAGDGSSKDGDAPSVLALAHITGGGLLGNLPRVLADTGVVELDPEAWQWPPVFSWLQRLAGLSQEEMLGTFNCGVGLCVVVRPDAVDRVLEALQPEQARVIGRVVMDGPAPSPTDARIRLVPLQKQPGR